MKARFLTGLYTMLMPDSDADRVLMRDFKYLSAVLGKIVVVPKGFVTDFASVPRLPLVYWLTAGVAVRAAVIHDYLYRSGSSSRKDADRVFAEAMQVTGQAAWRRVLMYIGLRLFGWASYHQSVNPVASGKGTAKAEGVIPAKPAPSSLATAADPEAKHVDPGDTPTRPGG